MRDFARLGFVLLNRNNYDVVLPLDEEPAYIPNAEDVIVVGQYDDRGFFWAEMVVFLGEEARFIKN